MVTTAPISRRAWTIAGGLVAVLAVAEAVKVAHGMGVGITGIDLQPPLGAAQIVLNGHGDIYADRAFSYLPSSALLFTPLAHVGHRLFVLIAYCEIAAVVASVTLAARAVLSHPGWLVLAGVVTIIVLRAQVVTESAYLENLNMFFGLLGVGVLRLMRANRWSWACALLALSVLIKPVLVPFFLVPLIAGVWVPVAAAVGALLLITALCASLTPGGWHVLHLPARLLGNSELNHLPALDNLTLSSIGHQHGVSSVLIGAAQLTVLVIVLVVAARTWGRSLDPILVGYTVLLATLLAGKLYELSYVFLLGPVAVFAVGSVRRHRLATAAVVVGALILYAWPQVLPASQRSAVVLWLIGTVLMFLGVAWGAAVQVSSENGR